MNSDNGQRGMNKQSMFIFLGLALSVILLVLVSRFGSMMNDKNVDFDNDDGIKKIIVASEIQDIYGEKQKVVVWIQNNSKKIFSGSIRTFIYDSTDNLVGSDIIYPENLKPGDKTFAILWSKIGASYIKWKTEGEFKELTTSDGSTDPEAIKEEAIKELFNNPVAYGEIDSITKIENWTKGERRKVICVNSKGSKSEYIVYFIDNQLVSQYLIYNGKETLLWNHFRLNPMD